MADGPDERGARASDLAAAAFLAVPAVLSFVLILHHPFLRGAHGAEDLARAVAAAAPMDRFVHGGLVAMFGVQVLGFQLFSARLGWGRPAVAAGFIAYAAGALLVVIPSVLDGFVIPDLAGACLARPAGCGDVDEGVFRLVAVVIQDFSKAALVALSAGTIGWAIALLTGQGLPGRAVGAIGLVCAAAPIAILLLSNVRLQPGNLAGFIASQVVWSLLAAAFMTGPRRPLPPVGPQIAAAAMASRTRSRAASTGAVSPSMSKVP
jgi:hypothetical protein